ncbi:unnamed protein product, partial [Oikopleura dioica]
NRNIEQNANRSNHEQRDEMSDHDNAALVISFADHPLAT